MEPAPELISFMNRFFKTFETLDAKSVVDAISRQPTSLAIGTALGEWWVGFETISALVRVQFQEFASMGEVHFEFGEVEAYREGSVGWAAAQGRITVVDVSSFPVRATAVVHEDGAYWRIVQFHLSVPVDNEETLNSTMTTSLDEILIGVQEEMPPSASLGSDGSVTIMFTDIEGSTSLMESLGEKRWLELLDWHDAIVRKQVVLFGGSVVKGQGDGFMLAFPAVGSAVSCAMAIQRALSAGWDGLTVPVRVGLHNGNVKAEAGDFFGKTVVLAARVASAAMGGEILVSQSIQEGLGGAFLLESPRSLKLRGLAGDYAAFPLVWQ